MSEPVTPIQPTLMEYLAGELTADTKHEFIDGQVYAMAGASEAHNIISLNVAAELRQQLKGKPCKPFMADMKINALGDVYYPDVTVICEPHQDDTSHVKHAPVLIVEVLSPSTRATDHSTKQVKYLNMPSLQYYVLVEQDFCEVSVLSRAEGFIPRYYYLGDEIDFPAIEAKISVEDIYEGIDNQDKQYYLEALANGQ